MLHLTLEEQGRSESRDSPCNLPSECPRKPMESSCASCLRGCGAALSTMRPGLFDHPLPRQPRRAETAAAPPPAAMARELRSSSLALSILAASVKWPCASSSLTCSKLGPKPSWYA